MSPSDVRLVSRRAMIAAAGATALSSTSQAADAGAVKAIAFDAFTVFDPRGITEAAQARFGERGKRLAEIWSSKLFSYTWLRDAAERYAPFEDLADDALSFAVNSLGMSLSEADRADLVSRYRRLEVWPDVKPALQRLQSAQVRLVLLSNLGETALRANMRRNGLETVFEAPLSTDRVRRFKPAPAAYQMAIEAFGLPRRSIGFAAFAGWDAAGAAWFGYRTAWINRLGAPEEQLDGRPAIVRPDFQGVLELAGLA